MGKGGDRAAQSQQEKNEVLIDGRLYDVTNLKHPGGTIINFYAGKEIDATEAFNNFHIRSKKADKWMKNLPSRAADMKKVKANQLPGQSELMADFDKLTKELEREGFFKPDLIHVFKRVAELIIMHAVAFYFIFNNNLALGVVIAGIAQGRCGWFMHEGGHYSLTGNISVDRALQIFFYGVGCGMSGGWWRSNHNKHHSMPQKLGHDVDLDTLPLVAFTDKIKNKIKGKALKNWISIQAILFPVITTSIVALGWQFYLHPRYMMRTKKYSELLSLFVRYTAWTYFITAKFGLAQSTVIYLAYMWIASNYIFLNFAVSHTHLDTVSKEDTQVDWVRYSSLHTMNVSPGPFKFVSWWMSYLNYQIEHHLYPSMPQFRHPIISSRVKKLFAKHGLPYIDRNYVDAMSVTFKNLDKVGKDVYLG